MRKIVTLCIMAFLLGSCENWLDVKPKTSINEDDLYSSESGFKDVLTGFYIKMGKPNLYGKTMTFGLIDLLAQRYDMDHLSVNGDQLYNFKTSYKSETEAIYADMYNLIANINNFLYQLEARKNVVTTNGYYEIMRGEALALRAFLHFDLIRMFGPVYVESPDVICIPYRLTFDKHATPALSARRVVGLILDDLNQAHALLEDTDSKIFNYDTQKEGLNPFLSLRQLRMNIYAVKAMLARVYLYKGDATSKAMAFDYAQEVVEAPYFGLHASTTENMVLFNEHIFSLNVYELDKVIDPIFNNTDIASVYYVYTKSLDDIYETSGDGSGDSRLSVFREIDPNKLATKKFNQKDYSGDYNGKNTIPLIRLPEMYYILAECDPDKDSSAEWLNTIRSQRGIAENIRANDNYDKPYVDGEDKTKTFRINEIMKEYMKELYGEGQLFFFYKRHYFKYFRNCRQPQGMQQSNYIFPIPDNEQIFGKN